MKTNEIYFLVVEMTRLLNSYNCNYKDAEEVIEKLIEVIKQQRDDMDLDIIMLEGNNYKYINKHISDDRTVTCLNHFEPYC